MFFFVKIQFMLKNQFPFIPFIPPPLIEASTKRNKRRCREKEGEGEKKKVK